jgi:hypothetical protein
MAIGPRHRGPGSLPVGNSSGTQPAMTATTGYESSNTAQLTNR